MSDNETFVAELLSAQIASLNTENAALRQRAERAERILAALRESSDGVQKAAMWEYWSVFPGGRNVWSRTIRAAVKAAEQEVGRE